MSFPINYKVNEDGGGAIGGAMGGAMGGGIEDLTDWQLEVLAIIKDDVAISYRLIAKQLDINESAVLKHIDLLKEKGYIVRIGGTRGYWQIIK